MQGRRSNSSMREVPPPVSFDNLKTAFFRPGTNDLLVQSNYVAAVLPAGGLGEAQIIFDQKMLIQHASFSADGSRLVVYNSGDDRIRVYRTSWPSLLGVVKDYLRECLPVRRRVELLGETPAEAEHRYGSCLLERKQIGTAPGAFTAPKPIGLGDTPERR